MKKETSVKSPAVRAKARSPRAKQVSEFTNVKSKRVDVKPLSKKEEVKLNPKLAKKATVTLDTGPVKHRKRTNTLTIGERPQFFLEKPKQQQKQ